MTSRSKNNLGQFRTKRGDTNIGTIEKKYNVDLGVRSDMKLSTYLRQEGFKSLADILDNK